MPVRDKLVPLSDRAGEVVEVGAGVTRDRPISPSSLWQNSYAERLIGTVRRECLDHVLVVGEAHLRGICTAYADYYNQVALDKNVPFCRAVQRSGSIVAIQY